MSDAHRIIAWPGVSHRNLFDGARRRLTSYLIRYVLVDSFFNFSRDGKAYPFPDPSALLPNTTIHAVERSHQNTALIVLADGQFPRGLNKHFRLRSSNQITWRNMQRLAPDIDLSDYKAAHALIESEYFENLLRKLLPRDYALLAQHAAQTENGSFALTHMHVKIERLTDSAIKELGKSLGYIDRRLFERGEDYVEALESKFFEYYGFSANASGRKSAAAMAAQLLKSQEHRFTVYVASQEDGRLTELDDSDVITQYMLIRPRDAALDAFVTAMRAVGSEDLDAYAAIPNTAKRPIMLYRLTLGRTAAARPGLKHVRDKDLLQPWLEILDQTVLPYASHSAPEVPFEWAAYE